MTATWCGRGEGSEFGDFRQVVLAVRRKACKVEVFGSVAQDTCVLTIPARLKPPDCPHFHENRDPVLIPNL